MVIRFSYQLLCRPCSRGVQEQQAPRSVTACPNSVAGPNRQAVGCDHEMGRIRCVQRDAFGSDRRRGRQRPESVVSSQFLVNCCVRGKDFFDPRRHAKGREEHLSAHRVVTLRAEDCVPASPLCAATRVPRVQWSTIALSLPAERRAAWGAGQT